MQQQPGDGSDHVPGWRWYGTGAQHQLEFSSLQQQSSPFRVLFLLLFCYNRHKFFFVVCFVLGFLYFWINLNSDPEVGVEKEHLWYFISLGCHSCNSDVFSCVSVKCEHPFPKSRTYWWNQNHYLEVIHCLLCYSFHLKLDLNLNCGFWLWLLSHPWFMLTNVFIIGAVPKRRRPARSIFDGFRDFQTETSKCLYIYYMYIYIFKF